MSTAMCAAQVFCRIMDPDSGTLPPELARYVQSLDFPPADQDRYEALSAKAHHGTPSVDEADELDGYLHVDSLIDVLGLKAERSLGRRVPMGDAGRRMRKFVCLRAGNRCE